MSDARRSRSLGLCFLAVMGLMGMTAVGAQGTWLKLGSAIAQNEPIEVLQHEKHGILLVPAKNLEILCAKIAADNSVLRVTPLASGLVELLFSECTTFVSKVEQKTCKPAEPIIAKGEGGLILHNGLHYVLVTPHSGETRYTRLDFPVTCALPDTNIGGGPGLVFECLSESLKTMTETGIDHCLNEELKHLLRQAPEALFPSHVLTYGVNIAYLDGIGAVELKNSDCKWSGHV